MPRLSKEKLQKISEQILAILYEHYPKSLFTSHIAKEIARDEEFTKYLLKDLNNKNLITQINKNSKGINYLKRLQWRLSNQTHKAYRDNLN